MNGSIRYSGFYLTFYFALYLALFSVWLHAGSEKQVVVFSPVVKEVDQVFAEAFERGLRLAIAKESSFRVLSKEKIQELYSGIQRSPPGNCFSDACMQNQTRLLEVEIGVGSRLEMKGYLLNVSVVMFDRVKGHKIAIARIEEELTDQSPLDFAALAGEQLFNYPENLIPPDFNRDTRTGGWLGATIAASVTGAGIYLLARHQGQIGLVDNNSNTLSEAPAPLEVRNFSRLRGFFALPPPSAISGGMGGAGVALPDRAEGLASNPAALATLHEPTVSLKRRNLTGDIPTYFAGYGSPYNRFWAYALGLHYMGDGLASESVAFFSGATDLAHFFHLFQSFRMGLTTKILLIEVGRDGVGQERATGHSMGLSGDFGAQWALSDKIDAGIWARDIYGLLWHRNTLTDESYFEILPPVITLGTAYQASSSLKLVLDGQKAILKDEVDHIRLGGEKWFMEILALRAGYQQIFTHSILRKFTLGTGIRLEVDHSSLFINYSYEKGVQRAGYLLSQQQFDLMICF